MRFGAGSIVLALVFLAVCVGGAAAGDITTGFTSEAGIEPVLREGNPMSCADMGCVGTFFTIESATGYSGTYDLGNGKTITITTSDDKTISWTSDANIHCIFLKGGPGGDAYSYCYQEDVTSDAGLSTPLDTKTGEPKDISHINICFIPDVPVPEFPVGFVPAFIIGFIGLLFFVREYK